MLTKSEIKRQIEKGNIIIEPFNPEYLTPNGYNLTLSNELMIYLPEDRLVSSISFTPYTTVIGVSKRECIDMLEPNATKTFIIPESGLLLEPGIVYLCRTNERTVTKEHIPMIEGRSSVARLGIDTHISSGFGHIGFDGYWTLEIRVTQPVIIYPNIPICQICYFQPVGEVKEEDKYNGRYNKNTGVESSKFGSR